MNPSVPDVQLPQPDPEIVLSSLLFLMSRYAFERDPRLVCCIYRHLAMVKAHPQLQTAVMRRTAECLLSDWQRTLHMQRDVDVH